MKLHHRLCTTLALLAACGDDDSRVTDSATTSTTFGTTLSTTNATDTSMGSTGSGSTSENPTGGSMSGSTTESVSVTETGTGTSMGPGTMTTDTTNGTSTTADTSSSTGSTTDPPPCQPLTCSDDLQQVICEGQVVEQCGNGTYCVDGACTPMTPCEAAELLKGSEGCNFWAVKTELINEASGTCFAAFIANTWNEPVHINVEYNGQVLPVANFTRIPTGQGKNIIYSPYDANAGLPPDEVAIVFLSRGPGGFPDCPVPGGGVAQETQVVGTGFGKAFRISTDRPVAAYQMLPYGGGSVAATSATLMLPTSVWDTNYVAINAYLKSQAVAAANPLFVVVADEDGTEITLDPKVAVVGGGGVMGGPAGVPIKYNLNRGQTIQFAQPTELTGSPLASTKRVGVFGGASCLNVKPNAYACDGAHQQIPPVKANGSKYVAVRYRNRAGQEESPPWRVVGMVNGTTLTWSPAKPAGAPDTLDLGQVVEFDSPGGYIVESQDSDHPFYLAGYMTGGQSFGGIGDPEWVNVVPAAQYLDKYVFFTDPTYSETNLVVVRGKKDGAFADVTLECAGVLGGWQPIGADFEYTRIDLVTGNFMDVGGCSNGRHEIESPNPFGVTVWGWGSPATQGFFTQYVSYAYPAGAAIKAINDVVVLPQ